MLHLDHGRELVCEPRVGLLSRVMRQMLLSHVGGCPFWDMDCLTPEGREVCMVLLYVTSWATSSFGPLIQGCHNRCDNLPPGVDSSLGTYMTCMGH